MAISGIVTYWNGRSGWIRPSDMEEQCTRHSRQIFLLASNVVSGDVVPECAVTFEDDVYNDREPWIAREISVS